MSFFQSTPAKPVGGFSGFGATSTPGFGAPTASVAPTFGTPSAAPATTLPQLTGFGSFGATSTTNTLPTLTGFNSFGGTATSTAAPSMFGQATATSSAAPSLFGGVTTSTAPAFGGFGAATLPTTSNSLFGGLSSSAATTQNTGFGGFGSTLTTSAAPTFGGFGGTTNTGFGGFTSSFGKPAASTVTPGFGGFGGNTNFMLGQPQQQQPQISADEAFAQSIFNVNIYGDERDTLIAKWNYLQAMWGTGKSFYSQSSAPVDITPQNYLCRFKAIGYSRMPGKDNKLGYVALNFNKPISEIKPRQQQILTTLNQVFGNKPQLILHIDSMKEQEDKKAQFVIYLDEKSQLVPNETKRILATDLANYLQQATVKPQLNNLGVESVFALVLPDEDQLKEYYDNTPKGIDPRMWRQANIDNPDRTKFIPVPMIGFNDLKWRTKCQENETEMHALYLKKVEKDLTELKLRHTAATAKIMEHKRKLAELSHRILKIIVKQECTRKVGLVLTPEEEALRTKLENMQALISAPTQFKGRLSELLSQMRMQRNQYAQSVGSEYTLDKDSEEEMMQFLSMQQKAMEVLTETVTKDLKVLQIISEGLPELLRV